MPNYALPFPIVLSVGKCVLVSDTFVVFVAIYFLFSLLEIVRGVAVSRCRAYASLIIP